MTVSSPGPGELRALEWDSETVLQHFYDHAILEIDMIGISQLLATFSEPEKRKFMKQFKEWIARSGRHPIDRIPKVYFLVKTITTDIQARNTTYKLVKKMMACVGPPAIGKLAVLAKHERTSVNTTGMIWDLDHTMKCQHLWIIPDDPGSIGIAQKCLSVAERNEIKAKLEQTAAHSLSWREVIRAS